MPSWTSVRPPIPAAERLASRPHPTPPMTTTTATSPRPVFREDHEQFRDQVRRFIEREITPNLHTWEKAGIVPRAL